MSTFADFRTPFALALALLLGLAGCSGDDAPAAPDKSPEVIAQYATMVHAGYEDALAGAVALRAALQTFVDTPSQPTLDAARAAWIAARVAYRETEAYRFYGGPIDAVEIRVNSWPLDEVYIDYVVGVAEGGMINDPTHVPDITSQVLADANMVGGETNVSVGYHAIEFLLWGQDLSPDGAGARPFTDYVVGDGGTAANQARRAEYLMVTADLLVQDLTTVRDAWVPGAANYAAELQAGPSKEALTHMLTGIGALSASELTGERMLTAYENKDQEDEHSCFSDTTLDDLKGNLQGIENVYLGKYGALDGPGLDDLVLALDPVLDAKMKTQLADAKAALAAIPAPFDNAIKGDDSAPGRVHVLAAVRAIQAIGDTVVEIATALGIQINVEL